mgnify:CR=1 FL=1
MVSHDDVKYVARLARLRVEEDDLEMYSGQLSSILNHIDKISELDLADVEPTSHVLKLSNIFREDVSRPGISKENALANGPSVENDAFRVPAILEG